MTTPTLSLTSTSFVGNKLTFSGSVDFLGDAGATLAFFLDPQPVGTSLGPVAVTVSGTTYTATLPLGGGSWKLRMVATPSTGTPVSVTSGLLTVNDVACRVVMPGLPAAPVVPSPPSKGARFSDPMSRTEYHQAVIGAPVGQRRLAGANATISAMGTKQRLCVFKGGKLMLRAEYAGTLLMTDNGTDITLVPGTQSSATVIQGGDVSSGNWTFQLQGGVNFSRCLEGTVGPVGSTKDIVLLENPVVGATFQTGFILLLPRSMDNLS